MASKRNPVLKSVYRRQLSTRLKELREKAELKMADVAAAVEINQGSLSRIESGDRGTTPVLVKAMLDCYGVTDPVIREDILDLVRADQAQRQQWWRKYSAVINTTQYGGYLALESSAVTLRNYETELIPGLLQTEEYARQVITSMRVDLTPVQVDALVKVRMNRKKLLEGESAAKLWAVIDEAAFRRIEDTAQVLRGQLEQLLEATEQTHVTVQMLPFSAGFHPGLDGSFVLMAFPEPNPDVVWVENGPNSVYFEGSADVERYTEVFDHLRARALGPPETRTWLNDLLKEL
ncbi:helix-turn-helix transcriptional regulator [Streptomyces sp. H10-C2]|uniref:helix-turn-helix domain-containing protein n=1 Tax=unclassified Streptomyces TaxID=2593676 RepID=UPI0024B9ABA7|nr:MULTISPECIES: helix-turn-helix transcriptional regulator [unclassified Streptomyces]MDJ0347179.1 helix-turn-helix transcriptional regulator [Streptomyces sp. PH10-H1]MDJ0375390.1 helix-turn-helix transcriptional regulator [Streptomyces sp. H10-C2]